ncbi:MAG TPA: hypothetical protein VGG92_12635 [Caulobacteraceae bacterium]|jgi:DNA-binding beta-propeller fold protein YncE
MRRRKIAPVAAALILALWPGVPGASAAGPSGYRILRRIPVEGTGSWDYVTIDSGARRLYVGRGDRVDVVDVDTGALVGQVTGLADSSGLLPIPELGRGFATSGGAGKIVIVDLKTLAKVGEVKAGKDPDSFAYDPVTKRVFIMNSGGGDATAINAADGTIAGTIDLEGQPEFVVADGRGSVFINITDKNEIVEADARTLKVRNRWSLAPCLGPSGLSMDRKNRRLFSVCDNQTMIVMDADTGKVVAALPTGAGTDASAFDPASGNAFASAGGAGTLTIVHEDSPNQFRVLEDLPTQPNARTMALDEKAHEIFLVTARRGHGSTFRNVLPGTFVVIVVGK